MAAYFFDTSAVVKRYANEPGSAWVQQVVSPTLKHSIYLARITEVEIASAITRRLRAGSLNSSDAVIGMRDFNLDFLHQYRVIEILPAGPRLWCRFMGCGPMMRYSWPLHLKSMLTVSL